LISFIDAGISDYLIYAEGTSDAYLRYIDIPAYKWGRKLGAVDDVNPGDGFKMSPEITKYTLPTKFLGIDGDNTIQGSVDQLSRAFVFGSPFKYQIGMNEIVNKMISIYINNKSIFMNGRYMDKNGLNISNSEVIASIIVSNNDDSLAIQIYNPTDNPISNLKINVDLSKLGIDKNISQITDLFMNSSISTVNNGFSINLDAKETLSYKVTLK
jgi:hypothetical protein